MKKKSSKNTVHLTEEQKRTYKEIAQEIISRIKPKLEICPDITAGYYKNGELKTWFNREKRERKHKLIIEPDYPEKTIVIVLESPHTKEYADENFINPALGKTGENLQNYFEKVLKKVVKKSTYRIILMNSIQFQCSCGNKLNVYKNKKTRDKNWITCFESECLNDLNLRLQALQPCAIINLCIKSLTELQSKLDEYIKCFFPNVVYTTGYHPCAWVNPKYAKINNISEV